MKVLPDKRIDAKDEELELTKTERVTKKVALAVSLVGVFIWFFKILFF